jgi:hypothetical protein
MKFIGEIVEIKERKTVSLDKEYTIKLRTEDNSIMMLSSIPSDSLVVVEIKEEHDSG